MKLAHSIKLSVFCNENEDENKIVEGLKSLILFNLEEEKIKINQENATGFRENRIRIFEIVLEKERHTNNFLKNLLEKLGEEQRLLLLGQAETRLDDELDFFIRFDKQKLIEENKIWITDEGNCYHLRISIAAFPAKKEVALENVKNLLLMKFDH